MNRDIVFCYEDDDCAGALGKMEERKLSHFPVVDREMRIVALMASEDLRARIGKATADHTGVGTVGVRGRRMRRLCIRVISFPF